MRNIPQILVSNRKVWRPDEAVKDGVVRLRRASFLDKFNSVPSTLSSSYGKKIQEIIDPIKL